MVSIYHSDFVCEIYFVISPLCVPYYLVTNWNFCSRLRMNVLLLVSPAQIHCVIEMYLQIVRKIKLLALKMYYLFRKVRRCLRTALKESLKIILAHVLSRLYENWAFPRSHSNLNIPLPRHSCYWYAVVSFSTDFLNAFCWTILFFRRWPIHGLRHCQLFTHQERQNKASFPSQTR